MIFQGGLLRLKEAGRFHPARPSYQTGSASNNKVVRTTILMKVGIIG